MSAARDADSVPRGRPAALAAGATLASLLAFAALLVAAALAYPGGSWADPDATRFDWLWNYWCDLIRVEAWNGAPNNAASALAKCAFVALALSLGAFWRASAPLLPPRLVPWVLLAGFTCALAVVAVALLPHDKLTQWHAVATLSAGGFGSFAAALVMWGSLRTGPVLCWRHVWGAALLLTAAVNIVAYVDVAIVDQREGPLLPIAQKIATVLLPLWMASTVRDARAASRASR